LSFGLHFSAKLLIRSFLGFQTRPILREINLFFESNALVAVVGEVGAGKTSLLLGLLGELVIESPAQLTVCGRISYAPQEPFVQHATVRQNILSDLPFDAERFV